MIKDEKNIKNEEKNAEDCPVTTNYENIVKKGNNSIKGKMYYKNLERGNNLRLFSVNLTGSK